MYNVRMHKQPELIETQYRFTYFNVNIIFPEICLVYQSWVIPVKTKIPKSKKSLVYFPQLSSFGIILQFFFYYSNFAEANWKN